MLHHCCCVFTTKPNILTLLISRRSQTSHGLDLIGRNNPTSILLKVPAGTPTKTIFIQEKFLRCVYLLAVEADGLQFKWGPWPPYMRSSTSRHSMCGVRGKKL